MGQQRREIDPTRSPAHLWGSELRGWRDRRGLSLQQLGALVSYNASFLAKVEKAERSVTKELAEACDQALRAEGALIRLWLPLTRPDEQPRGHVARPADHVANEDTFVASLNEGLASSEERISLPIRTTDGKVIFVSLPRRDFMLRGAGLSAAAALGGVVPAAAEPIPARQARMLARRNDDVNALDHLRQVRRTLIDSDNILGPRNVIPAAQEQVNLIQHLRQQMRAGEGRELVHLQAEYAELLGWFNQDLGDFRAAQYWMKQALEWSMMAGDPEMTTYFLARRSQLAGDMGDSLGAVDLGLAAAQQARPGSRLAIVGMTYGAFGHAIRGEGDDSRRLLDEARELLSSLDADPVSPWGVWLDESYIEVQRGRCLTAAGRLQDAVAVYETAIRNLPGGYHRDRGVYLARQGMAHAGAGQPERAAEIGLRALSIGESTESGRIITELAHLDNALFPWRRLPQVEDFRDAMNEVIPQQA